MKPQDWIIGSQNVNTEDRTNDQANNAWNPLEILKAGILNGMFKKDSEQLKIISDEICNFITSSGITLDPTDHTQLLEAINRIKASSLQFKGYVATSAPSSSTYSLLEGNMWINSATMPTSFPVSSSNIKIWDGSAWVNATVGYTPEEFHTFRNINDGEGYYWFGGAWKVMSTDMSTDYFTLNQTTGLWEISSTYDDTLAHLSENNIFTGANTFNNVSLGQVNLKKINSDTRGGQIYFEGANNEVNYGKQITLYRDNGRLLMWGQSSDGTSRSLFTANFEDGSVTAPTPATSDNSTKLATTAYVKSNLSSYAPLASPALTGNPTATTQPAGNNSTRLATTAFVATAVSSATAGNLKPGTIIPFGGTSVPTGYLQCNGAAVSRTTYSALFSAIGTTWGAGDGSTTFNVPNFNNVYLPTSYNLTVAIKGNGKTLGFTEGTSNGGLIVSKYMNGVNSAGQTVIHQLAYDTNVGTNTGLGTTGFYDGRTSDNGQNPLFNVVKTVGMTTDSSKSGLTGTTSISRMITQKWVIKY